MSFQPDKANVLLRTTGQNLTSICSPISIGNQTVDVVESHQVLGVTTDKNLSCCSDVTTLCEWADPLDLHRKEDSWERQHHHWHKEHNDTKSCEESPETNTRSEQVQMEHPWTLWKWDGRTLAKHQQRKNTRFSLVEKRINTSMALDFLFTRTSWPLSWEVALFPAGWSPSAWGQFLSTSQ